VTAYAVERQVALDAVRRAAHLCRAVRAGLTDDHRVIKADHSPVTVADLGSQALVTLELGESFPDDAIVAEEDAAHLRASEGSRLADVVVANVAAVRPAADARSTLAALDRGRHAGGADGRFWALDPVDGTKGFLRDEQYAVALALVEDGEVVVAALACPGLRSAGTGRLGTVFVAAIGEGAYELGLDEGMDGDGARRISVDAVDDPTAARYCESVEPLHSDQGDAARVASLLGITAPPLRVDSQCKYAIVARGETSIYLRLPRQPAYRERVWDHAAGSLLVRESGGTVTDVDGRPLDFTCGRTLERNRGILATNGRLHARVLDAVGRVIPG
jgi:HAL2 family 3'(2'),5'-bisphosphate nucleotidase